ncbi:MAG: hypothetical protein RXR20_01825 [Paraburkholderia sp.]|jgi:hypothetical protein|uniref:hypothetical protein n=1 Tax=Burkholderiaceae TaxID=119060 RepID=UPI0010F4334D|nr:hypothetical protein [Burkholderia sp. 4M9327F10]
MPYSIRISLFGFALAFAFESVVEVALLQLHILPLEGYLAMVVSLAANPLALGLALNRKKAGYGLLKWIATLSLVWPVAGRPYLHALGVWPIVLITLCVWCRVGGAVMMRRKTSRTWIDTATTEGIL